MFENISSTLQQCGCFLIFGAVMGLCYEPLRILRMLFRHNTAAVFIEDLLFFSLCGLTCFITALCVGIGYFRIYYIVFALLGGCCYFLTLGRFVNFFSRKAVKTAKRLIYAIYNKIKPRLLMLFGSIAQIIKPLFVNIADFYRDKVINNKKALQNADKMVYNDKNVTLKGGNGGSVIKAQIRKKT